MRSVSSRPRESSMQNTAAAENNPRASQGRDLRAMRGTDELIKSIVLAGVAG